MENKKENRAFNEMYIAAKKRLEGKNPIEIAKNSGAEFDEEKSILKIKSLDAIFELEYPTYDMKEKRDDWQILTLLHYLDLADNTPILSKQIKFGELKDGLIRGARFDKTVEVELERFLKNKDEKQVIEVFRNQMDANLIYVDASDRFLDKLKDINEPEEKRKVIGKEFIRVFEEEARKLEKISSTP